MTLYEDLEWRGLIKDRTNNDDFIERLNTKGLTFYWGTDPTADSLHIGHYSSLLTVKRLVKYGHHAIVLVGGATGMIGDPRPTKERDILPKEVIAHNLEALSRQLKSIVGKDVEVVNNYDWTKDINIMDFLRDTGKYINVNYMLDKDIIKRRLDTGITFAEFTYTLLQAYDFLYLYQNKNCIMQVEGSDQWGNITTGIDLINKKLGKNAYAFTMPLILDAAGNKIGKSEGNALWLDKNKTPGYDIYQYFVNIPDSKVLEYLKVYTFLTKDEIEDLMARHEKFPEKREAQKVLAYEFVKDLHGTEEAEAAKKKSEAIYSGNTDALDVKESSLSIGASLLDIIVDVSIAPSKSEARRLIEQGGISLDGEKILDVKYTVSKNTFVIQKGKKSFHKVSLK